jgi:hypothetical protein
VAGTTATTVEGWPWPADTALTRAKKVAQAYRAALGANNRALRDRLDAVMLDYGQSWVLDLVVPVSDDGLEEWTTAEAAEHVHETPHRIRTWATETDPDDPGRPLLPRFGRRGRETTYLARDVLAAARKKRGPVGLPSLN